jgi:uncharacterized protein (TIGR02646 family)
MRMIAKGKEPASLTTHRQTEHADYDNYQDKDTLRKFLVAEQRGLCCYCLSEIRPESTTMKIEHWHSQKKYSGEQLVYRNLLGACLGNDGQSKSDQYCDTRKGEDDLSRNPADPARPIENFIRFEGDGRIVSDDTAFDQELNDVLNLNVAYLKNQRKAALAAFVMSLKKRSHLKTAILKKWLSDWNGESHSNDLRPYCQVIVYWLRKRLPRA